MVGNPPMKYEDGVKKGLDLAIEHITSQHVVWDQTTLPPKALIDIILGNLKALRELK